MGGIEAILDEEMRVTELVVRIVNETGCENLSQVIDRYWDVDVQQMPVSVARNFDELLTVMARRLSYGTGWRDPEARLRRASQN